MKKVFEKIGIISAWLLVIPMFASAAVTTGLGNLLRDIHGLIGLAIPVLIALGVLAFMWGIVMYLFGKNKDEGRTYMLWGIIALFVMTSVWGLVGILRGTLFGTSNPDNARQGIDFIPNQ